MKSFILYVTFIFIAALFLAGCYGADEDAQVSKPDTRHTPDGLDTAEEASGEKKTPNRLIKEKSPYLLQHAYNPVDWYPWGPEAFEKARKEKKPIFLSIGYSACHWCHVMEEEVFDDPAVARLMNEVFVCIIVDREERPDIDNLYMVASQMLTGRGGWPLNIIMTPGKKPFFAATYIPRESRFGRLGMVELVPRINEAWTERKDEVLKSADEITEELAEVSLAPDAPPGLIGEEPGTETLEAAYKELSEFFDPDYGGFSDRPKFPKPHNLFFLLRYWKSTGEAEALEMVERTLNSMRRGGIYDHVGFGFHRYSTDREWLVPHFEKMLHDQALIALAYVEAYQATGNIDYEQTAREIFTYVLRDMTSPPGGFYSTEDADTEGEEGRFYLWSYEEITRVLSPRETELAVKLFNVTREGNSTDAVTGEKTGANILHLKMPLKEMAKELDSTEGELKGRLESARIKLFEARKKRIRPHKDDKVLTDWNGLMIAALAKGSRAFTEPRYEAAAEKAAEFILKNMRTEGRLLHRWREGEAAVDGFLDDYAFFIWGLIELYEATFRVDYLRAALELNDLLIEKFWDETEGGFYFTAVDSADLPVRTKQPYDGALPSGNSVAMYNLLRLGRITADPSLEEKAARLLRALSRDLSRAPSAFTQLMVALGFALGPTYEVVIAGDSPEITTVAGFTKDKKGRGGKATAFVCINYTCHRPTTDKLKMLEQLGEK
jgi:uncharacterized protein YyaL (SSP411 family)